MKFRTTTAELWYVFEHSPHPFSWLWSNSSLASLVFLQKALNSARLVTLTAAFSVSEYSLLEATKFLKSLCSFSTRLTVSLDKIWCVMREVYPGKDLQVLLREALGALGGGLTCGRDLGHH